MSRINEDPVELSLSENQALPWEGLNTKELNDKFAYKPYRLFGKFDHSKEVLVERQHNGDNGFEVFTPFFCYFSEAGEPLALIVDRGWVPKEYAISGVQNLKENEFTEITGIIYKNDHSTKDR